MEAWGGVLAGEAPWEREGGGNRCTEERLRGGIFEESQEVGAQRALGGPPLGDVDGRATPRGLSQAEIAERQAGTPPAFKARREL